MPITVCMKCQKFFHPKKQGVVVEEGMPRRDSNGNDVWVPYKLWMADLHECRSCGTQIVTGFGHSHFAEHYQKDYAEQKARQLPLVFVEDCL